MNRKVCSVLISAFLCLLLKVPWVLADGLPNKFVDNFDDKFDDKIAENIAPEKVGFQQNLGAKIPLDLIFFNEEGSTVKLENLFVGKPSLLVFFYSHCPNLCTLVDQELLKAAKNIPLTLGADFRIIFVSLKPFESFPILKKKKDRFIKRYLGPENKENPETLASGLHYLTADEKTIDSLAEASGFNYSQIHSEEDAEISRSPSTVASFKDTLKDSIDRSLKNLVATQPNQPAVVHYAHPGGLIVTTPDGKISRYFLGAQYHPREVYLSLVEASQLKIGALQDRLLLLCSHYDPKTGKYGLAVNKILKIMGLSMMTFLFFFIAYQLWQENSVQGVYQSDYKKKDIPL